MIMWSHVLDMIQLINYTIVNNTSVLQLDKLAACFYPVLVDH